MTPGKANPPLVKWGTEHTDDEAVVRRWWSKWPNANVGIACGPSGLCVVDLDVKGGKDGRRQLDRLEVMHDDLPVTLTARTPSGGWHIYLRGEARTTVDLGGGHPGVDTRSGGGKGGYVLAPGSETSVGEYTWEGDPTAEVAPLPDWLRDLAGRRPDRTHTDEAAVEPDQPHNVEWAVEHLRGDARPAVEGQGGNDATFRVACTLRDKGISEGTCLALMLEHYNPRCEPPWETDDLARAVTNAYRYASVVALGGDTAEADFAGDEPPEPPVGERERPSPLKTELDRWVWVAKAYVFVHRKQPHRRLTVEQFNSFYAPIAGGSMVGSLRNGKLPITRLMDLVYIPNRREFPGEAQYNLWRDSGVKASPGDHRWFEDHLSYLVPDPTERGHVLDWLSLVVRGEKVHYALLLASAIEGNGKSAVGNVLTRVLGRGNVSNPGNKEIAERFTAWAEGCQLAVIAELKADGRADTVNHLKPYITDETMRIEVKGRTAYDTPNHVNLLCSTNHLDALPLDATDRRWLVVTSQASPRDEAYYNRLFGVKIASDGAVGAVKHWLLTRPVALDPKGRAPDTAGKQEMGELGMSEAESWLRERLEAREHPFQHDLVRLDDVAGALDRMSRSPRHDAKLFLSGIGAVKHTRYTKDDRYTRSTLWSVRDHQRWEEMGASERAKAYSASEL